MTAASTKSTTAVILDRSLQREGEEMNFQRAEPVRPKLRLVHADHYGVRKYWRQVGGAGTGYQGRSLASTSITRVSGSTPSDAIATAAPSVSMAFMTTSRSAMSMSTATRVGFCGSTNVRMFVTPSGPKNSSRFGDASQCFVSLTL